MSGVQIFTNVGLNQNNITGDAQGETAAFGDNDKSLATTEFVQNIGLKFGNSIQATGAATLDASFLGKLIYLTGASPYTITLPDNSLFLIGTTYSFSSHSDSTITISSPQSILTKNGTSNSINVAKGDSFTLTKKSTGEWILYGSWGAASGSFQPLNDNLTGISTLNPSGNGIPKKTGSGNWIWDTNDYLITNQNITISGDASGSGNTAITLTLANSGVTAGTYQAVTVDAKGRVIGGTNPTTLAGYGITDAAPLSHVSDTTLHLTSAQNTWIDAISVSSTEVNYLSGVTSSIQTQLNSKQPLNTELTALSNLSDNAGYIRKTGDASYIIDTTMPVIATLNNGMPSYVEPIGGKTISIDSFTVDFALNSGGTRNVYLQFGDDFPGSATFGQPLPDNCTLKDVLIYARSVGTGGATAQIRKNGSATPALSYSIAANSNQSYVRYSVSENFDQDDVIAVYVSASSNFSHFSVRLTFAWRN